LVLAHDTAVEYSATSLPHSPSFPCLVGIGLYSIPNLVSIIHVPVNYCVEKVKEKPFAMAMTKYNIIRIIPRTQMNVMECFTVTVI